MLEEHLTTGEKVYLLRRRSGMKLRAFAAQWGFTGPEWLKVERDEAMYGDTFKDLEIGGLLGPYEHYLTLRRRKGWNIPQQAKMMGLNDCTLEAMEAGKYPLDRLIAFWGH